MSNLLRVGDLASADGPYVRADGTEVKPLKYLEVVSIKSDVDRAGEVLVVGLETHATVRVLASSLTRVQGQRPVVLGGSGAARYFR